MKRVILFRFHKFPMVCRNHVEILKKFNPEIEIYGLYGGPPEKIDSFKKALAGTVLDVFDCSARDGKWKWENGDLAVRDWFNKIGKNVAFDMLHVIEWDMLFFAPLAKIYAHIPKDAVGLTGLTPLKPVAHRWWWTAHEPYKSDWERFLALVKDKYNYGLEPFACIFGGVCISRFFLEKYSKTAVPEICHDELRTPLFAQIFGIDLFDTKLAEIWQEESDDKQYFQAGNKKGVPLELIMKELHKDGGRRVFHPYHKIFRV